ncbi:MAG TPA: 4-(cytidine 5'-diphospho)-2-C-methyl-D-erythritol kinase [Casimicrobiaceae bacterium]|nr:4-(cytidine 5'-diphospho)-2-C-methyl-D-erythritol kinase [Casimicrobiaceae bacterium]
MLTLPAPAKINAFLHVTGRRPDGYHTLESLFVPVDRCDLVSLEVRDDGAILRTSGADGVAEGEDLAVRAARLLQRDCGVGQGVAIGIDKRLPIAGGLGGGSSDAATVLLGLNRLWRLGLSRRVLMQMALELGADVPFFVFGEPAFAQGVGEELLPVTFPPTWFAIVCPAAQVSTASVFAAPELTRNSESAKMVVFSEGYGRNDLYAVAAARFPDIVRHRDALTSQVARSGARMTGSGGCVFAAFDSEDAARQALLRMPRDVAGFVARSLNRHPLWSYA